MRSRGGVVARPRAARRRRWGSAPGRSPSCRGRRRARPSRPAAGGSRAPRRRAAASSSTKRSPAASCSVAPSPRTASETRKPSRPRDADDGGGMELDELEVGQLGAGGAGEQQAGAVGAGRVRRARPQRGGAARGEDDGAGGEHAPVVARHAARRGRRRRSERAHAAALEHRRCAPPRPRRPRAGAGSGGPVALPPACDDAADAVAALEAEREVAVAVGVEAHAERLEVGEARGRLRAQDLGGRAPHEPAPGARACPRRCELRRVVDRERGGEPALRPVGGGLGERPRRDERHAGALPGGA